VRSVNITDRVATGSADEVQLSQIGMLSEPLLPAIQRPPCTESDLIVARRRNDEKGQYATCRKASEWIELTAMCLGHGEDPWGYCALECSR
jgi:hypothetical protein